jgi:hypothetical protein
LQLVAEHRVIILTPAYRDISRDPVMPPARRVRYNNSCRGR